MWMVRRENEEYQKELLEQKETTLKYKMKCKEKEAERMQAVDSRRRAEEALTLAEQRGKDMESVVREERKNSHQKLENLLDKERGLEKELATAMANTSSFSKQLNVMINRMSFKNFSATEADKNAEIEPPIGKVSFLFTDVERSTEKWDTSPQKMQDCLILHNKMIRDIIKKHLSTALPTIVFSFDVLHISPLFSYYYLHYYYLLHCLHL
jgi:hypothetical protein